MEIIKSPVDEGGELFKYNSDTFTASDACFDKFRQQILSNQKTVIDSAVQIYAALPNMPTRNIEFVMDSISFVSDKLWYLRALCIAELLQRREPLPGGRSRRAAAGEGHKEFIREWAAKLGIGTTKLQQDLKIVEVFSKRFVYDESGKITEVEAAPIRPPLVLSEEAQQHNISQTIKFEKSGEYIEAVAYTAADDKPLYVAVFTPHKDLSRELYVVMSKIGKPEAARQLESELIELAERGEPVPTAVALSRQVLKHSAIPETEGGFFEIRREGADMQTRVKFTMTREDSAIFKEVAELALEIEDFPLHTSSSIQYLELFAVSGDGYKLMINALKAYRGVLKTKFKKSWTIEPALNPENFTLEISQEKKNAGHAQSKLTSKMRREKKRLTEVLEKLEKTMPDGIDKESDAWKRYEKQLIKLSRLEEAAFSARDAYLSITMKNLNLSFEEQEAEKNKALREYREVEELTGNKTPDAPPAKTKKPK